jgi:hypothetical protein
VTLTDRRARDSSHVARSAPNVDSRLVAALARIDDGKMPIAEACRRLGALADHLDLTRPSYEQVRVHLHAVRRRAALPGAGEILLDIALRVRPPDRAVYELLNPCERQSRSK